MRRRLALVLACALLLIAAQAAFADSTRVDELGEYSDAPFPNASCPAPPNTPPDSPNQCFVMARATGVTMQIGNHHNPFHVKQRGDIVALTLQLSKPNASEIDYFKTTFGGSRKDPNTPYGAAPQVRVAVLKPLHTKHRFVLEAESEVIDVENHLGQTVTFALRTAVPIHKDRVVGLTVPTWLPALGHPLGSNQAWRASYRDTECNPAAGKTRPPRAHEAIGTYKQYGCFFRYERPLYTVTYVPKPATTGTSGP
ncbi:MAG: hypothetical protein JOZ25_02745 [Actinobacteria bacterium]|nr:hypothetical protein [Actinomycetota bacterium]